ncbi:MAG TPA: sigma-70 family RNA polymerase sigma factor [Ideonella sp.]|uniref:sigma-70 family RNA polymerase sigma factor n=1 Tax=Ideonella sp. TaxID=1929293 RepID=UPI002CD8E012|nr:sigma-70 family RNA polymerase sigma factor [Ideonella sp.]HSI50322.1 sigma-70 family RNA polymerase sigma factor [Ideonella sp.]
MPVATASSSAAELAALMARVALGDRAAFRALYDATAAHLLGVVLRIQPERGRAEEVLQEVFVKVWAAASSFDAERAQAMTWLHSLARHAAIDSLRRQKADPVRTMSPPASALGDGDDSDPLEQVAGDGPGPVDLMEQALQARAVRGCMGRLQNDQRQSLALAFYDGLTHAEVAQHLGQPLGTVKSWLRRGLLALQKCLAIGELSTRS